MPEAIVIAQFERRLAQMGCPALRIKENVRELAEHFEDLKRAARDEGLTDDEAQARAIEQLGNPIILAENAVAILRYSSWWGRHPFIGFFVMPVLAFELVWVLCVTFVLICVEQLGKIFGSAFTVSADLRHTLSDHPDASQGFMDALNVVIRLAAMAVVIVMFWRMGRRAAVSLKWMLAVCISCAALNLVSDYNLEPCKISAGMSWPGPHWFFASIPLLFAGILVVENRMKQLRFAGIPGMRRAGRLRATVQKTPFFETPTFWIATVLGLVIAVFAARGAAYAFPEAFDQLDLKMRVWPVERAATMALLKTREAAVFSPRETTINLKPWLTATLADSIDPDGSAKDDNLAALPMGIHVFGDVPFDIEGRIQLGDGMRIGDRAKFPTRARIPIYAKCWKFYVLQGAVNLDASSSRIAWLTVHYQDGSKAEMDIDGGKDVLDCWGPIYNTDAGAARNPTSADTLLAWAGTNPAIKDQSPNLSLRLYRTVFTNPHPDLEISSIEYVSALSGASPFLLGLTIEKP